MTALAVDGAAPVRPVAVRSPLGVLAAVEARRFARHPLFLGALLFTAYSAEQVYADTYRNHDTAVLELTLAPAFFLGLGGMVVAYRLTRSTRRADEALAGVPASEPTRTAALIVACLVPFVVAAAYAAMVIVSWHVEPMAWGIGWQHWSAAERDAMMVGAALAGLGGPVLGVCLGRWWRWPGGPLLASVLLVSWSTLTLAPWESRLGKVWHMSGPYTLWYSGTDSDLVNEALGGSPVGRVAYLLALVALAAVSALLHGAAGDSRTTLRRWWFALVAAAVLTLLVAALTGPDFTALPKP